MKIVVFFLSDLADLATVFRGRDGRDGNYSNYTTFMLERVIVLFGVVHQLFKADIQEHLKKT